MVSIIANKATLVNFSTSAWGVHKSDKGATNEVLIHHKAERHSGSFRKRLLNKKATAEIRTIKTAAGSFHKKYTLPWLDDGTRILPNVKYLDYTSEMNTYNSKFNSAVNAFIKEYTNHMKQAQKELGTLFKESDYPPAIEVKKKYSMRSIFLPWPDKQDFRGNLDDAVLKEIGASLDKRLEEVLKASMTDIAERVTEVVGHMAERLKAYKPGDRTKGKKTEGKFHDSLVIHVRELADLLPGFNLTDNSKLTAITKQIKEKLSVHEPDALRDIDKLRKQVIKDSDDILKRVKEFLS